jgi:hypothetical protein
MSTIYPLPLTLNQSQPCISTSYLNTYQLPTNCSALTVPPPDEQIEQERQRAERLAAQLRDLGIDPD